MKNLTRYEYFAGCAMQGLLANEGANNEKEYEIIVLRALILAAKMSNEFDKSPY